MKAGTDTSRPRRNRRGRLRCLDLFAGELGVGANSHRRRAAALQLYFDGPDRRSALKALVMVSTHPSQRRPVTANVCSVIYFSIGRDNARGRWSKVA
ncbi:hypothetical protein I551_8546 [Mycobacterium ulcerans str. Harvey]|uniref:Uncharacterized protein n=1 Tax=Mycobacterium ulcerans str. Harvey TaxID=1299332 RepID=A0ABN0RAZ7_MYCUL|nr:hypothetical protein I551_8546 [Mycobacterium ulcerans str. Harvey]